MHKYCRQCHHDCNKGICIERAIGIYLSNGPINPCDFIRYLLIYGACLDPAVQIAADVTRRTSLIKYIGAMWRLGNIALHLGVGGCLMSPVSLFPL